MRLRILAALVMAPAAALFTGCAKSETTSAPAETHTVAGHAHDGYWCNEHGVPEELCAQCSSKIAADYQRKGDWCATHDRPDSQCFVCHPELEGRFAAQYEAKFGEKPPKPEG